jgi:hypothetical protein
MALRNAPDFERMALSSIEGLRHERRTDELRPSAEPETRWPRDGKTPNEEPPVGPSQIDSKEDAVSTTRAGLRPCARVVADVCMRSGVEAEQISCGYAMAWLCRPCGLSSELADISFLRSCTTPLGRVVAGV